MNNMKRFFVLTFVILGTFILVGCTQNPSNDASIEENDTTGEVVAVVPEHDAEPEVVAEPEPEIEEETEEVPTPEEAEVDTDENADKDINEDVTVEEEVTDTEDEEEASTEAGNDDNISAGPSTLPTDVFTLTHDAFTIHIAPATAELLASFLHIYEYDYSLLRGITPGDHVVIWSPMALQDVAVIGIQATEAFTEEDGIIYEQSGAYGLIPHLLPGEAFTIIHYVGVGTLPWSGIAFTDETGTRHRLGLLHDQSDSANVFVLWPITVQ